MYLNIIFKTIFLYFFIIIIYRILGKKELGQLSIIDLIVSILIVELSAIAIDKYDESILVAVIPISVIVAIQLLISFISLKSNKFRYMIEGKPVVIIKDGKINFSEMIKIRYNLDDLITQLRERGVENIEKVKYAVLENNGNLSVFKDLNDYPLPLILDGKIDYLVLHEINKDIKWLNNLLEKHNLTLDNVFYAFYTKQKTFIIKKSDLI